VALVSLVVNLLPLSLDRSRHSNHDTAGIPAALLSAADSGESLLTACTSIDGTAEYGYDPTGQLTAATYTSATGSASVVPSNESYSYDSNGNRTTSAGSATIIGPNNELLSDGTYTYRYDADGNCIQRATIATGAVTTYAWTPATAW